MLYIPYKPKPSQRERERSPPSVCVLDQQKKISSKTLNYSDIHITHGRRTNQKKKKTNTPTPQHNERGRAAERIPAVGSQHHRIDVGVDVVIAFFFDHHHHHHHHHRHLCYQEERKRSLSLKRCARVKPRATSREGDEEDATISTTTTTTTTAAPNNTNTNNFDRDLNKFVKKTATTFAPSSSGDGEKKKNPATKGTALYAVFEVQAYLAIVVGGLLAFNVIYPSRNRRSRG